MTYELLFRMLFNKRPLSRPGGQIRALAVKRINSVRV